jgi:hypothetical protein
MTMRMIYNPHLTRRLPLPVRRRCVQLLLASLVGAMVWAAMQGFPASWCLDYPDTRGVDRFFSSTGPPPVGTLKKGSLD